MSTARAVALRAAKQPVPDGVVTRALVDTGASCTCIDPTVLAQLNLSATGKVAMMTPSTGPQPQMADQYDVGVSIYGFADEPPLHIPTMPVAASDLRQQGIDGLIGRDVLDWCVLIYNGEQRTFTLAF